MYLNIFDCRYFTWISITHWPRSVKNRISPIFFKIINKRQLLFWFKQVYVCSIYYQAFFVIRIAIFNCASSSSIFINSFIFNPFIKPSTFLWNFYKFYLNFVQTLLKFRLFALPLAIRHVFHNNQTLLY